ncbi:response regulator transcription factor [Paenibacillus albus]|uniref:Response regulator n=1 Tax=Paenibacillus albus TaxID=2495582 RepID=A0A3S9A6H1_9BACL|nr:helix-turn-helix domain-containing protein [Paenibacillus albus]AZN41328.1 response regulator [Paenibacillus albus]
MYRILIAEDELPSRKWLMKKIDWEALGFELVAAVPNGAEAWELLQARPDIRVVLTDIRMPQLDGLELTRRIRTLPHGADIEIVILSGFGDFAYAQEAIRGHVGDYLLKPVSKEQVETVFENVYKKLDNRADATDRLLVADQLRREKEDEGKRDFYKKWFEKQEKIGDLSEELIEHGIELEGDAFVLMVVEIDQFARFAASHNEFDTRLCQFIVMNILKEIADGYSALDSVLLGAGFALFIFPGPVESNFRAQLTATIGEAMQEAIHRFMRPFPITVSIGAAFCDTSEQMPACYRSAVEALRLKFFTGLSSLNCKDASTPLRIEKEIAYPVETEKQVASCLKRGETDRGVALFEQFLDTIAASASSSVIRVMTAEMLVHLLKEMREVKSLPVPAEFMLKFTEEIKSEETFSSLRLKAVEHFRFIMWTVAQDGKELSIVARGIEYMKIKLNRDISLQEVAEYVGVSSSYFSVLFKQEKTCNFVDYLIRIRMERSLELLESTGNTIATIGEEVGYQNYRYFTKVFKEYHGFTPTQYREGIRSL